MRVNWTIVVIFSIYFVILSGCFGCVNCEDNDDCDDIDVIENHPECKDNPTLYKCLKFYTTDRETCEETYGDEAPRYCPEWFAKDKNECLTKIPEEMRLNYCFKFMTETPEDCKRYFPDDYMKKCPKFFLQTAEDCKRVLPDSYLKDPHCASLVLTSKEACISEFENAYKAIILSELCFDYFAQDEECRKYFSKCNRPGKENCIDLYGEEDAKLLCPEYYVSSKEECIEAFGGDASSYCPQFFTRTKEECVDTYKADARHQCPQFFARTKEECMQNFDPNEYNRYCPQFFR